MRILIVNGPNLNLLGARDPQIYGETTLPELEAMCRHWATGLGVAIDTFQSNHEGEIIDRLHDAIGRFDGIIINPGALTHYSYAIFDAITAVAIPTVEVHISNIEEREDWRKISVIRPACIATVMGEGIDGYRKALTILSSPGDH